MMSGDIYFYDLNFNLLKILPPTRYKSIIAQQDYCGSGSLDIIFLDGETGDMLEEHIDDGILVIWRKFQGILTSFLRDDDEYRAVGTHLNGIIKRLTAEPYTPNIKVNIWTALNNAMFNKSPGKPNWISQVDDSGDSGIYTFDIDKRLTGDEYVKEVLDNIDGGYNVVADFKAQYYYMHYFKHAQNNIVLSKNNLNVQSLSITCNNKNRVDGGWWKNESSGEWNHLSRYDYTADVTYHDVILSATTEKEARAEFKKLQPKYEIKLTTKNLDYKADYNIGDVVRLQDRGKTFKMVINSVKMWEEKGYGEEPILTKYEED